MWKLKPGQYSNKISRLPLPLYTIRYKVGGQDIMLKDVE